MTTPTPRRFVALLCLFFVGGLVGCDHATKSAAETVLSSRGVIEIVPGVFDFRYARNHDTAFSLLQGSSIPHKTTLLAVLASIALVGVGVAWWRRRARATASEHVAFAMILAGAVGNVSDRLRRGFVVDFIHVSHWPVFNVADIAVVAGVLLLALTMLRARRRSVRGA